MNNKNWADIEDNDDFGVFQLEPVASSGGGDDREEKLSDATEAASLKKLETVHSPKEFNYISSRKVDHIVLMDLDTMKKGVGKIGFRLLTDPSLSSIIVIMFRRAVSKSQRYALKQVCSSCKSSIAIPITSKMLDGRVLVEGTPSALSTKYLMGLYAGHLAYITLKKRGAASSSSEESEKPSSAEKELTGPHFTVVSADDGVQELCSILKAQYFGWFHSVRSERSDSFDHLKSLLKPLDPNRHVVPRQLWEPENANDSKSEGDMETVLKRVRAHMAGLSAHLKPRTKASLEKMITPLCVLRGDIDSRAVLELLRKRGEISLCVDLCSSLSYPKLEKLRLEIEQSEKAARVDQHEQSENSSSQKNKNKKKNNGDRDEPKILREETIADDSKFENDDSPDATAARKVIGALRLLVQQKKSLPRNEVTLLNFIRTLVCSTRSLAVDVSDVIDLMLAKGVVKFEKDLLLSEKDYPAVYHLENLSKLTTLKVAEEEISARSNTGTSSQQKSSSQLSTTSNSFEERKRPTKSTNKRK